MYYYRFIIKMYGMNDAKTHLKQIRYIIKPIFRQMVLAIARDKKIHLYFKYEYILYFHITEPLII